MKNLRVTKDGLLSGTVSKAMANDTIIELGIITVVKDHKVLFEPKVGLKFTVEDLYRIQIFMEHTDVKKT